MKQQPPDSLDWNLVRSFIAVVDAGSLTGAARTLALAHPTVARHIQQLEAALGVALFDRRPTGLALNRAGARLAASARGMLDSARAFERVTRSVRTSGSGLVRVLAPESLAPLLPRLLTPLRDREPADRIRIELLVGSEESNLLQQGADMVVRHSLPEQQDLICRRLAPLPYGLFAARSYVNAHGMPEPANLAGHWFVDGVREPRLGRWAEQTGRPLDREQFVFRADAFTGQLHGALAGWGIAALPAYVGDLEPELLRVLGEEPDLPVDLWLVGRPEVRSVAFLYEAFAAVADVLNGFVAGRPAPQVERVRPNRAVTT